MAETSKAGRKSIPVEDKKVGYKIYITPEQHVEIDTYGIGGSFSEKCVNLVNIAINAQRNDNEKTVKFIDLFAGLGGIRIGFEEAAASAGLKAKCVFSSEIKKYAVDVYKHHFHENKVHGDITKVKTKDIPDFDVLLAGFPCQPFSPAGSGKGFYDTRGTMFFEIERILKEKMQSGRPVAGFLLENVDRLVTHDKGNTLSVILSKLRGLGYKVNCEVLDSQYFGLAQSRKRVYIVGCLKNEIDLQGFRKRTASFGQIVERGLPIIDSDFTRKLLRYYRVDELPGKAIKDKRGGKNNIHSWDFDLKGTTTPQEKEFLNLLLKERRKKKWAEIIGIDWMDGMPLTFEQISTFYHEPNLRQMLDDLLNKNYLVFEHPKKLITEYNEKGEKTYSHREPDETKPKGYNIVAGKLSFEFSEFLSETELVPTLVAMDAMKIGVIDGTGVRHLSVKEGQRLCGYDPDNYDLSMIDEEDAFDLLGNTVCVPVIEAVAERLIKGMTSKKVTKKVSQVDNNINVVCV